MANCQACHGKGYIYVPVCPECKGARIVSCCEGSERQPGFETPDATQFAENKIMTDYFTLPKTTGNLRWNGTTLEQEFIRNEDPTPYWERVGKIDKEPTLKDAIKSDNHKHQIDILERALEALQNSVPMIRDTSDIVNSITQCNSHANATKHLAELINDFKQKQG